MPDNVIFESENGYTIKRGEKFNNVLTGDGLLVDCMDAFMLDLAAAYAQQSARVKELESQLAAAQPAVEAMGVMEKENGNA